MRIVSLVPSLTEAVAAMGCLDRLVGRTRYCVEPAGRIEAVPAMGGTKNPDIAAILAAAPDLVLVNKEENRREDAEALAAAGLRVHASHPRTVAEAVAMLAELAELLGVAGTAAAETAGDGFVDDCRRALVRAEGALIGRVPVPVFCPIWRNPWMTFGATTYIGDMLRLAGARSVVGRGATDFFEVDPAALRGLGARLAVLPDEPYMFGPTHGRELVEAGVVERFVCIDGKDLSWYGPRIPGALQRLAAAVAGASGEDVHEPS